MRAYMANFRHFKIDRERRAVWIFFKIFYNKPFKKGYISAIIASKHKSTETPFLDLGLV